MVIILFELDRFLIQSVYVSIFLKNSQSYLLDMRSHKFSVIYFYFSLKFYFNYWRQDSFIARHWDI